MLQLLFACGILVRKDFVKKHILGDLRSHFLHIHSGDKCDRDLIKTLIRKTQAGWVMHLDLQAVEQIYLKLFKNTMRTQVKNIKNFIMRVLELGRKKQKELHLKNCDPNSPNPFVKLLQGSTCIVHYSCTVLDV